MNLALFGLVAGTSKPALVAAHHFAVQRRGIDNIRGGSRSSYVTCDNRGNRKKDDVQSPGQLKKTR